MEYIERLYDETDGQILMAETSSIQANLGKARAPYEWYGYFWHHTYCV